MANAAACIKQADDRLARLIGVLEDWARWQAGYRLRLGYPARSVGLSSGFVSAEFDEMMDEADQYQSRMVEAAIDDLVPVQAAAIHKRYLCAVYRCERVRYEDALALAHEALLKALPNKGVCL